MFTIYLIIKTIKMPKEKSPNSKNSIISLLGVGESVKFENANSSSIRVVCSQIKLNPENKDKRFKVSVIEKEVTVQRTA